jgi:hypothetical protein
MRFALDSIETGVAPVLPTREVRIMKTLQRHYCWVVLACLAFAIPGCEMQDSPLMSWSDIGSPDDVTARQAKSRANRGIPQATEMPPGLGEDLPVPGAGEATPPVTRTD